MAKAHSPMRLEQTLVDDATLIGHLAHRSTAEQIEYWADLGRKVARFISPEVLLDITSGLAVLKPEPVQNIVVAPDSVFNALERDRTNGTLSASVTSSRERYQASSEPGYLEQITPDGTVTIGTFKNGQFVPR